MSNGFNFRDSAVIMRGKNSCVRAKNGALKRERRVCILLVMCVDTMYGVRAREG